MFISFCSDLNTTRTHTGQVVRTAVVEVLTCDITVAGYTVEEARAAAVLSNTAGNILAGQIQS